MAAAYRLGPYNGIIQRVADGVWIPPTPTNRDYIAYQAWVVAGGVADPYVPPPAPQPDWLTKTVPWATNVNAENCVSTNGRGGFTAGVRLSDAPNPDGIPADVGIGLQAWVFNDETRVQDRWGWAIYAEGRPYPGAQGVIVGEYNITNISGVDAPAPTPYRLTEAHTQICMWLASGGGSHNTWKSSTALGIVHNGAPFRCGIVFDANAIDGTNGVAGVATAIQLAKGHRVMWYTATAGNVAGVGCDTGTGTDLFAPGIVALRTCAPTQGQTGMLLAVNAAGTTTLAQVKIGAPDSGGPGLRALVVDN